MVLCPIISKISSARLPEKSELFLVNGAITQPMVLHVHRFCLFRLEVAVYYSLGSRIVGLDWRGGLQMPHLLEDGAFFNGLACINI